MYLSDPKMFFLPAVCGKTKRWPEILHEVRTLGGRRSKGRDSRDLVTGHFGNSSTGQFLPKRGTEDGS